MGSLSPWTSAEVPVLDAYACLVVPARWTGPEEPGAAGWQPGPLPLLVPSVSGEAAMRQVVSDREGRATYFSPRVQEALYGSASEEGAQVRWHRVVDQDAGPAGASAEALELLISSAGALLVVHVSLGADPVDCLAGLTATVGHGRDWLSALAGEDVVLDRVRARSVTHLLWEGPAPGPPPGLSHLHTEVGPASQLTGLDWWAWFLAAGVSPRDFVPDVEGPDWTGGRLRLSRDWSAVVLRDGISYVARTAAGHATAARAFHEAARVYVRTLHVDALLLGILQRTALHRVADSIASLDVEQLDAEAVEQLERDLLRFRTGLWWNDVARRGQQTSDVLVAFQQQHRLPELYDQIVQDLTDLSRYWTAREAAEREAVRQAEERERAEEERRERRAVNAITFVSFVLLPLTVIYSATALIADPGWLLFLCSTGVGLLVCLTGAVYSRRRWPSAPGRDRDAAG